MALGAQEHRESGEQRNNYTCFAPQRADADVLHTLKKTSLEHTLVSCISPYTSLGEVPSRAHLGDVKQYPLFFQVWGVVINFTGGKI